MLAAIDYALAVPHPQRMLTLASRTALALEPGYPKPPEQREDDPFPMRTAFVEVLAASGLRQHRALAWVLAHLCLDEPRRRPLLRVVEQAGLPPWMLALDNTEVYAAWQSLDVLRENGTLALGVRLGRYELTVVARLDLDRGVIRDGCTFAESLPTYHQRWASSAEAARSDSRDLSLADARAQLEEGLTGYVLPTNSGTWPGLRPLLTWLTGRCPPGGHTLPRPAWSVSDTDRMLSDFFGRADGQPFADDPGATALLQYWLDDEGRRGFGDPLLLSGRRMERVLLGWVFDGPPVGDVRLSRLPALLEAFVPVAHERRGIDPHVTAEVVAALHEIKPRFLEMVAPQNFWNRCYEPDDGSDPAATARRRLVEEVGGPDQLVALDADPLPLEPLDLTAVPEDLHDRLRTIDNLCAEACRSLLDEEVLTAVRRLITDIAVARPAVLRRRAKDASTAAALCWLAAHHNGLLGPGKRIQNRELTGHFGVTSVTGRADSLRSALIGERFRWPSTLRSARYLIGSYRSQLIGRRDAHQSGVDEWRA